MNIRVFSEPQPSILAASSNSFGTATKNRIKINTNIPSAANSAGRVKGIYVSRSFSLLHIRNIGIIVTIDGMSILVSRRALNSFLRGKSNLEKPYATRTDDITVNTVLGSIIIKVLRK